MSRAAAAPVRMQAVLPAAPRQGAGGPVALRQGVGRDAVPGLLLITCEVESSGTLLGFMGNIYLILF